MVRFAGSHSGESLRGRDGRTESDAESVWEMCIAPAHQVPNGKNRCASRIDSDKSGAEVGVGCGEETTCVSSSNGAGVDANGRSCSTERKEMEGETTMGNEPRYVKRIRT